LHYRAFLQPAFDISLSKISTASKGLDYGCGPGPTLSQMFLEKGVNMNIYDPYFYPNKNVLEKKYDFITCTEVVEHFYQPDHEFNTLFSLLKESGFLCIQTMFFESIQSLQSSHYPKDPTHVCFYGKTSLSYIAKKHHVQCEFPRQNLALFST
ncbi:MAG: class I SAM-dependent methyltransferase, partial [Bdellovibrionales bacterium]|nr:class I SAM-dependent methyltransferase [Bdellovibrionales bacterium]